VQALRVVVFLLAFAATGAAHAQTFFGTVGDGVTVGVDRGSTVLLPDVDVPTGFVTFDTYGSEDIGPDIGSLSFALPDALSTGDQFDILGLLAGSVTEGETELVAGGVGYRFPLDGEALSGFVNADYADVVLGGDVNRALDAKGSRANLSFGVRRVWEISEISDVEGTVELRARHSSGDILGRQVLDENLRILRAAVLYESGVPFGFRKRAAVGVAKGLDGLGSSEEGEVTNSIPGASPTFLRVSLAGEASLPLSERWVVNGGIAGQWADATLPLSERCGYGTNAYSRGFDVTLVNGDKCLGSRIEGAYFLRIPSMTNPAAPIVQGFAGLDFGGIWNVGNIYVPADSQTWSSATIGVRAMTTRTVAEITVSRILDDFTGIIPQDETRVWFRLASRF
jgi:hemolysin activation/secretion protein